MSRRLTLVLGRYLPQRLIDRIHRSCPWVDVVADERAMSAPEGKLGFIYSESERGWRSESGGESVAAAWERLLPDADVLFDLHPAAIDLLPLNRGRAAFIQSLAAGAGELLLDDRIARAGIPICTARGIPDEGLTAFTMAAILAHAKRLDDLERNKQQRLWLELEGRSLAGTTMVIVGLGSIGRNIARCSRAFGVRVHGIQRRPRACPDVESTHSLDELDALLPKADWVVDVLPGAPETNRIFDEARFSRFRTGAFFVNVGRGSTVDELALCQALASGLLGGAALDAYDEEPLADESPLWDAPHLVLSPHSSALIPGTIDRIVDVLIDNLDRLHGGRALRNLASAQGHVDPADD